MYINLNERKIEYFLKKSLRARHLRLSICCGGNLTVTAPRFVSQSTIDQFISTKSDWVLDKVDYFKNISDVCKRYGADGEPLPIRRMKAQALAESRAKSRAQYLTYKDQALLVAQNKVAQLNTLYGFKFNKISIKNQSTRWGSCSRKGNLNFNYKIALLPDRLADYLVVHELCHLGQFNHSTRFWSLVARAVPDYKDRRRELKTFDVRK